MTHFENVACTVCGCLCDDLRIEVADGRVVRAKGACPLSEPWLLSQKANPAAAAAQINGQPAPLDDALAHAAAILRDAHSPLVYGLSRSSTDGQRAAVALAEAIGATIDTSASLCHAPSVMAVQEIGEITCTLGEVKNRADLVIFWGVDPVVTHPRHMERYSVDPIGRYIPDGRAGRTVIVADVKRTATAELADIFLPIERGKDYEVLSVLRQLLRGQSINRDADLGISLEQLEDLAARMKACRFGVVFFGLGLSMSGAQQHNVEALLLLVRDLNAHTRFCVRRMRIPGDVTGADTVLIWQTGFPFSVNLARGYPRYEPTEFSAQPMLERGDVDACLFVGSEGACRFSPEASAALERLPTIVLDYPGVEPTFRPTVRFTTAVYGVHRPGTAYRMDGVPIPLRPFLASDLPSDEEVLERLTKAL